MTFSARLGPPVLSGAADKFSPTFVPVPKNGPSRSVESLAQPGWAWNSFGTVSAGTWRGPRGPLTPQSKLRFYDQIAPHPHSQKHCGLLPPRLLPANTFAALPELPSRCDQKPRLLELRIHLRPSVR